MNKRLKLTYDTYEECEGRMNNHYEGQCVVVDLHYGKEMITRLRALFQEAREHACLNENGDKESNE